MSSSDSNLESSYNSEDYDKNVEIEVEDDEGEHVSQASRDNQSTDGMAYAYADKPYVDEEWLKKYEKEEEDKKPEEAVQARLDGKERVDSLLVLWLIVVKPDVNKRSIYYGTSDIYICMRMRTAIDSQSILQAAMSKISSWMTCLVTWNGQLNAKRRSKQTKSWKESTKDHLHVGLKFLEWS